jgi:calcineurin-like phosphoesterase family protein
MAIFFTSDTHFGHGGALGLFGRPFASVRAMDEALIARWNQTVGPDDTVWHLGDLALGPALARAGALLDALAGQKHLIAGNNDPASVRALPGWASVADYAELDLGGAHLVLCHFPFRSWSGMAKGALNLHGHSHGRMAPLPRQIDVGVDAWDFAPVALDRLLAPARRRHAPKPDSPKRTADSPAPRTRKRGAP